MMTYPTEFSKAVLTVLFVADKVQQGYFDFVPTGQVSSSLGIPKPTVAKLLQRLSATGIIETREGIKGGVRLARKADEVSVLDVLEATSAGRPLFRTDFGVPATGERPSRVQATLLEIFQGAEASMKAELGRATISDVLASIEG